ncbi:uncharacterized protein [Mytilus edulis]|uniref:uncharacterized protein n=1 Tax=Mytilus edulis TaxID=6550 RepID=UPI0039EFDCA6
MEADLHQRPSQTLSDDIDTDVPLGEEAYEAEIENNGDILEPPKVLVDPGPFLYNRRVCVVALPVFLLMLSMVGETLVLLICFGLAVLLCVDNKGLHQRSMVVFMSIFVPSHILIIYSFFPLIWVSVLNLILLVLVNAFILMTGAWIILQFKVFRMNEYDVCVFFEETLFAVYPAISAGLLCWAASTVVPIQHIPFLLAFIGFVFLQLFMAPTTSSFRKPKSEEDNCNILKVASLTAISVIYCTLPTILQIVIHVVHRSQMFHISFVTEVIFLSMTQIFLLTLMSIRPLVEALGHDHSLVVKLRWLSGASATILCYPVLMHLGISSHFLPWLPAAIGTYSVFGAVLSYKKTKRISDGVLAVAIIFSVLWGSLLPWKLAFKLIFGLPLPAVYVMMLTNAVLCLLIGYVGSHGRQEMFSILVCIQTVVFVCCETVLYDAGLYRWQLFIITCVIAAYTFQRLHLSKKLPLRLSCFCMSLYLSKATIVLIEHFVFHPNKVPVYSYVTILFLVFMIIRIFVTEFDTNAHSFTKHLGLLCVSVIVNANPLIYVLSSYIFMTESAASDIAGLCSMVCGVLIIIAQSIHVPEDLRVRYTGVLGIFLGLVFIVFRPDLTPTLYSVFQWIEVFSVISFVIVMVTDSVTQFLQIMLCSAVLGLCPGFRAAIMLYPEDNIPVSGVLLFMLSSCIITCIILCFIKAQHLKHTFEKRFIKMSTMLAVVSMVAVISDIATRENHQMFLTLPSLKLILCANLVISICLKLLALRQIGELLPLTEPKDDKEVPYLPTIGNIATFISFVMICLMAPTSSFFHDVWCCGASLVLVCLQKDMRIFSSLREDNQTTATKITSLVILVTATLYRSDIWNYNSSWMFARGVTEIILVLFSIPNCYILWGLLYDNVLVLNEQVVIFTLPLNFPLILYSSSYTGWALAVTGIVSSIWMMFAKFALQPYHDDY